jgi:hypothetical protein
MLYQQAILFAAERHSRQNQTLPDSNIPYVVHLSNVCMEILIAAQYTENFNRSSQSNVLYCTMSWRIPKPWRRNLNNTLEPLQRFVFRR